MDINLFVIFWMCGFCLIGIILISLSQSLRHKANKLIAKCTSTSTGVLNEVQETLRKYRDSDGHTKKKLFYFPIYEFEVNGEKYKIRDTAGHTDQNNFEIGSIVEIKYNPENPEECYKEGDFFSKAWIVFLVFGIICIIQGIGIGLLIKIIFK